MTAGPLALTWWGHSSVSLDLGGVAVATDPLLVTRLFHLQRTTPAPPAEAARAQVVLISHLHHDHLHLPSLRRFAPGTPVVVPRGAAAAVPGLSLFELVEVAPGDEVEVAGVRIQVLPAHHDGRRSVLGRVAAPAIGFRLESGGRSCWYPGDTGLRDHVTEVEPVDLALVPIGGWGPTLGEEHLNPVEAATAVGLVGAEWSLAVHYGTFWPMAMRRMHPANHRRLFVDPPTRFVAAVADQGVATRPLTPRHGERLELGQ